MTDLSTIHFALLYVYLRAQTYWYSIKTSLGWYSKADILASLQSVPKVTYIPG